jgi:hypothetical protein
MILSKLTNLNSFIIQQDGDATGGIFKLDLRYLEPLTNLEELAIQPYTEGHAIIEPVTKLVSLKALILNCGFSTQNEPTSRRTDPIMCWYFYFFHHTNASSLLLIAVNQLFQKPSS